VQIIGTHEAEAAIDPPEFVRNLGISTVKVDKAMAAVIDL
jgi:hypothetical protein